ncbi:hypothetical protein OOK31_13065 [Streptomyces sp. NBC_00249]|nr:hypothetical protein [Streptomyces sp. NBC_00249]MCX5194818.1 hypothetical protein [Streptomyces sp. NBC_00249]
MPRPPRLAVVPRPAYLLHDGSTERQERPSAAAFWLGRWPRGILPSLI